MTRAWQQLTITCQAEDVPSLTAQLKLFDAHAISCLDAADQPLYEPRPGEEPLWQQVQLVALFDKVIDAGPIVNYFLSQESVQAINQDDLPDQDWERAWMDDFKPMCFGQRLWICPSWCEPPEANAINLRLDPGLAFGTGTHATTALCLEWLDGADLKNKIMIDYGCGSGVLAVAGLLLGADVATGIDIDPQALDASRENAKRNAIDASRLQLLLPEQGRTQPADLLVANILAEPLKALSDDIVSLVKPGGQLVLSGILEDQAEGVMAHYGLIDFDVPVIREGWVRLSGSKKSL